jgi:hypothetical protein
MYISAFELTREIDRSDNLTQQLSEKERHLGIGAKRSFSTPLFSGKLKGTGRRLYGLTPHIMRIVEQHNTIKYKYRSPVDADFRWL